MEEPVQKSLERYDVLDRIAVGGMAEVFLAKAYGAHGFEKTLAIKRILPELAKDPEFAARFIAEAKVAVRLSHANIVQVFDFGRIGESLFIAMEYVDGLDLAAMLRKFKDESRPVPLPAAFHIAIEIIRALDFAHGHNIVHRDVSPSNILISRAGEVKIADFGIAVAARPHRGGGPGPRKVMGKWRYMSPEQARGDTLDTRSDMFSAASVIFELFTGTKLFPGEEAEDIIKNIETMPIPKMASLRPGLPSRLDDVLAGPLARKPIDRPTRPATILRALIELSYESSIMATALDVAEALATVVPAKKISGAGALDDVIRKQLNDNPTAARRTAVTDGKPPSTETLERNEVSTGLFRKLDLDGLSRLEELDTKIAAPRARRASEQVIAMPGDDVHLGGQVDRDRFTEVGGPPTGTVPKLGDLGDLPPSADGDGGSRRTGRTGPRSAGATGSRAALADAPARSRGAWWALVAAGVAAAGGVVAWRVLGDQPAQGTLPPPPADASPSTAVEMGGLEVLSDPPGATGTIDGKPFDTPTPVRLSNVPVGKHIVRLELDGYEPMELPVEIVAGSTMRERPRLTPSPATLTVTTDPPGAQVSLDGRVLGTTPIEGLRVAASRGARLSVTRAGYKPMSLPVDLIAGKPLTIDRTLEVIPKQAYVALRIEPGGSVGWGDAYLAGKKVGRAPGPQIKLPVGRVRLQMVNAPANAKWEWTCEVEDKDGNVCVIKAP